MAINLVLQLGVVFVVAFLGAAAWQKLSGYRWDAALHRAFVFAVIAMLLFFLFLIVTDIADLRTEPPG